jgi:hypothetical protein
MLVTAPLAVRRRTTARPSRRPGRPTGAPLEMIKRAWDGPETHTDQGYNVGKAPNGDRPVRPYTRPDCVLALGRGGGRGGGHRVKSRAGPRTKTLLAPDPVETETVRSIYTWRIAERLGYPAIARPAQRRPGAQSAADPARAGARRRAVDCGQRARRARPAEVHRLHGVEPAGDEDRGGSSNPVAAWCGPPARPTTRSSTWTPSSPPSRSPASQDWADRLPTHQTQIAALRIPPRRERTCPRAVKHARHNLRRLTPPAA